MKLGAGKLGLKAGGTRSPSRELVERRAPLRCCLRMWRWCQACMPSGLLCLAFPFPCSLKKKKKRRWCSPLGCVMNNLGHYALMFMFAVLMLCFNVCAMGRQG